MFDLISPLPERFRNPAILHQAFSLAIVKKQIVANSRLTYGILEGGACDRSLDGVYALIEMPRRTLEALVKRHARVGLRFARRQRTGACEPAYEATTARG